MNILAFDCALRGCSAAAFAGGRVRAEEALEMARGQGDALLPLLGRVLARAGLAYASLDALATTVGPGSYTGLRIGLAAAAGIALAGGLPVVGVTTLEAIAAARLGAGSPAEAGASATPAPPKASPRREAGPLVVALESRRDDLFWQIFAASGEPLTAPAAGLPEAIARALPPGPLALAGDGAARLAAALPPGMSAEIVAGCDRVAAGWVAGIAARRLAADPGLLGAPTVPAPLYLRAPLVTPAA